MRKTILAWCTAALVVASANAATPPADPAQAQPQPAPSAGDPAATVPHDCLTATGTHIPPKDGKCVPAQGRVITSEEIKSSGATSVGDAVRRLTTY